MAQPASGGTNIVLRLLQGHDEHTVAGRRLGGGPETRNRESGVGAARGADAPRGGRVVVAARRVRRRGRGRHATGQRPRRPPPRGLFHGRITDRKSRRGTFPRRTHGLVRPSRFCRCRAARSALRASSRSPPHRDRTLAQHDLRERGGWRAGRYGQRAVIREEPEAIHDARVSAAGCCVARFLRRLPLRCRRATLP